MVGGDGVCYRRRIQQAAHYTLNGTIVKSLASRLTEVERDIILSQQNGVSFGQGRSAVCQNSDESLLFILVTMQTEAVAASTFQLLSDAQLKEGPPLENTCEGCAEQPWPHGLLLFGNFSKQMQILQLLF